jgi:hypothetical protein
MQRRTRSSASVLVILIVTITGDTTVGNIGKRSRAA